MASRRRGNLGGGGVPGDCFGTLCLVMTIKQLLIIKELYQTQADMLSSKASYRWWQALVVTGSYHRLNLPSQLVADLATNQIAVELLIAEP